MSVKSKIIKFTFKSTPKTIKKWIINKKIKGLGKMVEFRLDTKNKELYAKALLAGEVEPIEIHIQNYQLIEENDNSSIIIEQLSTSRIWITTLLNKFILGKKLPIPKDKLDILTDLLNLN